MYLSLRQYILVSDNVSRSQAIYLGLNQYILVLTNVTLQAPWHQIIMKILDLKEQAIKE